MKRLVRSIPVVREWGYIVVAVARLKATGFYLYDGTECYTCQFPIDVIRTNALLESIDQKS